MKWILPFVATITFLGCTVSAASVTQKWTPGWDNFAEPLDFNKSAITWSISAARELTVTFSLVAASPNKLYQVGIHMFCTTFPATFGQFPVAPGGGDCLQLVRQGVTKNAVGTELGVVTTDRNGKGSLRVVVGPISSGRYELQFTVRNGSGCNLSGGAGDRFCAIDFQSPGPFGTTTTLVVP